MTIGIRAGGLAAASILVATLVTACDGTARQAGGHEGAGSMRLTSAAFVEGGPIPARNSRLGSDLSPQLAWEGAPEGTRSFALACVDRSPVAHGWVHWLVVGIPADAAALPEGASGSAMPHGSRELVNGFGTRGWGGPQPPPGTGAHVYEFTVYALDVADPRVADGGGIGDVLSAVRAHVLTTGVLNGTFER